jgi:hypothetical protein
MNNNNNVRDREAYNMKKIKKFNSVDHAYNTEDLKNLILKQEKVEKPNIDIKALANQREKINFIEFKESEQKLFLLNTLQPKISHFYLSMINKLI